MNRYEEKKAARIQIMTPDYMGRIGFASFSLQNNNANMATVKKRISFLEKQNEKGFSEKNIGDVKIIENVEENRCQIFFPDKPSESVRSDLKSKGFRWSPSRGCWQRHRSNVASTYVVRVVEKYTLEITSKEV